MRIRKLLKAALWTVGGLFAAFCLLLGVAVFVAIGDPPPRETVRIPFEFKQGHLYVTAMLDGKPIRAVLDSGAPVAVVDMAHARSLGLPVKRVRGAINGQPTYTVADHALTFGGRKISSLYSTELGLGEAPLILGTRHIFNHRVVEVDFNRRLLVLHRRKTFVPPPGAREVALTRAGGLFDRHYAMPVSVNGSPPILAEVDLGSDQRLALTRAAAKRIGLKPRQGAWATGRGINVRTVSDLAEGEVTIAGHVLKAAEVEIAGPEQQIYFDNFEGNLGTRALASFHLWLDLTGKRLWLTRPPRFAIGVVAGEGPITAVATGGPAARAGIKVGDRITAINGQPTAAYWASRDWTSPAPLKLSMEDGRTLTIQPIDTNR